MTTPAPSGGPSPLRVGGLALLGVGAVAGIIGLTTLATGNGIDNPAAAPPTSASVPAEPGFTSTDGPPTDGGVPVPSFGPTPTAGIGGPGGDGTGADGTGGDGSGGDGSGSGGSGSGGTGSGGNGSDGTGGIGGGTGSGGGAEAVRMPLRVYNNSTIQGLAERGAGEFRSAGWTVTEVGGYNGLIPTSTVYYENPSEQAAAEYLAQTYGLRAEPRFDGIRSASPGVIIILTQDYQGA